MAKNSVDGRERDTGMKHILSLAEGGDQRATRERLPPLWNPGHLEPGQAPRPRTGQRHDGKIYTVVSFSPSLRSSVQPTEARLLPTPNRTKKKLSAILRSLRACPNDLMILLHAHQPKPEVILPAPGGAIGPEVAVQRPEGFTGDRPISLD